MEQTINTEQHTENMTLWDAVHAERAAARAFRGIIHDDSFYMAADDWKDARRQFIAKADAEWEQATKVTDALLGDCPHPWHYGIGRSVGDGRDVVLTIHDESGMVAYGPPSKMLAIHGGLLEEMDPKCLAMVARALLEEQGIEWDDAYHEAQASLKTTS